MNVIDTNGMTREQWLALRRQSIGASDAPVIAGLSRYKTRFGLWLEKTGQSEPEEAGEQARWGLRLEDDIEDALAEHGVAIESRQIMIRHADRPWMTATVDAVDYYGEGWEFKATTKYLAEDQPLPEDWVVQTHYQMLCADRPHWNVAAFIGPRLRLARWHVERDLSLCDQIMELAAEFRRHIEDRTPPVGFDAADAALLLKHYRDVEPVELQLDPTSMAGLYAQDYKEAMAWIAEAEERRDTAKAHLLALMAGAGAARCGPYLLRRSQVNVKAQPPKPKAAYSYTKFTFTDTRKEDQ